MTITEEMRATLTPEELADLEAAQEGAMNSGNDSGEGDAGDADDKGKAKDGAGDGDGNGAGDDGDKGGDKGATLPSDEEIRGAVARALQAAQEEREQREREAIKNKSAEDEWYEKLEKVQFDDPREYNRMLIERAKSELRNEVVAEMDAKYGATVKRTETEHVASKLAEGLGAHGREYVKRYAPMIDPAQADDPGIRDIIRRAARDFEREKTPTRELVERTRGDVEGENSPRAEADLFAKIAAAASGRSIDDIRLTDAELNEARRSA